MGPDIYTQIASYKISGTYPDGLTKTEKNTFRKRASTFEMEGKKNMIIIIVILGSDEVREMIIILLSL